MLCLSNLSAILEEHSNFLGQGFFCNSSSTDNFFFHLTYKVVKVLIRIVIGKFTYTVDAFLQSKLKLR